MNALPPQWIYWAPLAAASLHIFEEFVFPGGFPAWDRQYRPHIRKSITPKFHIVINALLLLLCYDAGALGARPAGVWVWMAAMALLFSNAWWHVAGAIRTRSYSPGVVTGVLLYIPIALYGYVHFIRTRQAPVGVAIVAALVGGSYHLWSPALHAWRNRRVSHRTAC